MESIDTRLFFLKHNSRQLSEESIAVMTGLESGEQSESNIYYDGTGVSTVLILVCIVAAVLALTSTAIWFKSFASNKDRRRKSSIDQHQQPSRVSTISTAATMSLDSG